MSKHNETGKLGEELAQHFLRKAGYRIREVNWRYHYKEIDIIAEKDKHIVFVEVKTRSTLAFELPKEAVTIKKQKNLVFAADAYLQEKEIELASRFDIVSVLNGDAPKVIEHLQDAFQANDLI